MGNDWFEFKKFRIEQKLTAMKVGTDGVLLGAWTCAGSASRILDVGSGTGLLALMLAQRCESIIDGVEKDQAAFLEADYNVKQSDWKDRLSIFHDDFLNFSEKMSGHYDLIVSNPPFFSNSLHPYDLQSTLAKHDVSLTYEQLLTGSAKLLKRDGRLSVIIPYENLQDMRESARMKGFYLKRSCEVVTKEGKTPARILLEFSLIPVFPEKSQLILRKATGEFSDDFKRLTSSYYLNF